MTIARHSNFWVRGRYSNKLWLQANKWSLFYHVSVHFISHCILLTHITLRYNNEIGIVLFGTTPTVSFWTWVTWHKYKFYPPSLMTQSLVSQHVVSRVHLIFFYISLHSHFSCFVSHHKSFLFFLSFFPSSLPVYSSLFFLITYVIPSRGFGDSFNLYAWISPEASVAIVTALTYIIVRKWWVELGKQEFLTI